MQKSVKHWKCSKGCNLEELREPCPHLEKELPKSPKREYRVSTMYELKHHKVNKSMLDLYSDGTEYDLRIKLARYELSDLEIDVLVDLFANSLTVRQINRKYGIPSMRSFYRIRDIAYEKLKARGSKALKQEADEDAQ